MVDETPDEEAEAVALEGYDPQWVSLAGLRAAQRAGQRGEFSIDRLTTMADWYTRHLANKPRASGRQSPAKRRYVEGRRLREWRRERTPDDGEQQ